MPRVQCAYVLPNLLTTATSVAITNNPVTNYPASYLHNNHYGLPGRADSEPETIDIDHGSAKSFDTIGIMMHNLGSGGVYDFKAGTTVGVSDFSESMEEHHNTTNMFFRNSSPISYRYAQLSVTTGAYVGDYTAGLSIGELVVGSSVVLTKTYHRAPRTRQREQPSVMTQGGVRHVQDLWKRRIFELRFSSMTTAELDEIKAMEEAAIGMAIPFLFIPDILDKDCYFVRIVGPVVETPEQPGIWRLEPLVLEENPISDIILA